MAQGWKTTGAVLLPEILIAPPAAIGSIYCATQFLPNQFKWLADIISDHVVQPHLNWFESLGGHLKKARDTYAERKREQDIKEGKTRAADPVKPSTPKERADVIADVLLKGATAMTADLGFTLLGQRLLSKRLFKLEPLHPGIAFFETAVHLGGIAFMAGPLAVTGENIRYGISKTLHNNFNVDKAKAEDAGLAIPYIVIPGQIAAFASLGLAHSNILKGRGG